MAVVCNSEASCAALAARAIEPFQRVFAVDGPVDGQSRCACGFNTTRAAMQHARSHDATALATSYWASCGRSKKWCHSDQRGYYSATWQPFAHVGGRACRSMSRFGPPLGPNGDGGKTLCEVSTILRDPGCLVVSVGLYDDTRFEEHFHRAAPQCEIVALDGTLNEAKTSAVPKYIKLMPTNFGPTTYQRFADRKRVSLLKIDCDGCEFASLPPWVDHICTEHIVVEMHRKSYLPPQKNAGNIHNLMLHLHAVGYRIAFLEPNPFYPKLGTEYTLVKNTSCY